MLVRLFVFFGSLLVLALCAALIGPYFVDWTSYRADFEREASAILGRKVEVRGDASARLLPFPSVSFTDVVVSDDQSKPILTAESFSMDAELAPFLKGEVLIFDMRLQRPKAELTVSENGVIDWALRPSTPVDPGHIVIENLSVVEGQLLVRDAAHGRDLKVVEINTDISARSLNGPWRAVGSLRVNGRRTTLTATTGVSDGSGQMSLGLSLSPEVFPVKIDSEGQVANENGALRYKGTFHVAGAPGAQAELRDGDGKAARPEAQSARNRASGSFALTGARLDVDAFRFESGPLTDPYSAEGSAFLDLGDDPRFLIQATGQQFEVEDDQNGAGGKTLGERLQDIEDTLALVPEPTIPGSVDLKLPAVVAGTTVIRDVSLSARPENKGWRVLSASAQLPGRSMLEADGFLEGGEDPRFAGNLLLAVKQPTGFAAWLSKDIENAVRTLPAAGFRSTVAIDRHKQTFSDIQLILGPTRLTGAVERTSIESAKPVIVARLSGDTIDADTATAFAAMLGGGTAREHDLDVALKAGAVSVAGVNVTAVDTAVRLTGDRLDVDRLSIGDLSGASIAATGSLANLQSKPSGEVDVTATSTDFAPLADQLAVWAPNSILAVELARRAQNNPGLLSEGRLDIVGSLSAEAAGALPNQMAIKLDGAVGGSTLQGSVEGAIAGAGALETNLTLTNPDATQLLAMAGLPTLPVISLGQGTIRLSASRAEGGLFTTRAGLEGEGFSLTFDGLAGQADEPSWPFTATGKLVLKADDVEPWLLAVGTPSPGMGFGSAAELTADADFSSHLLVLSGLSGTIAETSVAGDLNVGFGEGRPDLSGALTLDSLDLEPVAAVLFGAPALTSADGLSWPTGAFVNSAAAAITADLDLSVGTLAAGVLPSLHDATLGLKVSDRQMVLSDIAGKGVGGAVSGHVDLTNEGGNGLISAQLAVKDADLAMLLPQVGISAPALTGRADVSASFGSSGGSVDALVKGLSGSGVVNLENVGVAQLNGDALPALIGAADALGQQIDAAATQRFAPAIVQSKAFAAGDASFAFNMASGVLRAAPTQFGNDKAALTTEGRIDMTTRSIEATADFALKPGDEELVGSEPTMQFAVSGPVDAPEVALNTDGLAQFLTQRQLEIEQARVEAMQASILEKQRLRREVARYEALNAQRAALVRTEAQERADLVRLTAEAERRRVQVEAEQKAKAEAEAEKAKAEAEAEKAKAEETAKPPAPQAKTPTPKIVEPEPAPQPANAPVEIFPPPPAPPADFGESDFDG